MKKEIITMNTESFDMCRLILEKLKEKDLTVAWLARQIGCDDANLGRMLKNNRHIHAALLFRISKALRHDFFVYYSSYLHDENYVDEN